MKTDYIVTAEFKVEGILEYYPRLYEAIDNARQISGTGYGQNTDFEALVEFTNGQTTLRDLILETVEYQNLK